MLLLQGFYARGEVGLEALVQRLSSWEAHLIHGDTHRLRRKIFDQLVFVRELDDQADKVSMG